MDGRVMPDQQQNLRITGLLPEPIEKLVGVCVVDPVLEVDGSGKSKPLKRLPSPQSGRTDDVIGDAPVTPQLVTDPLSVTPPTLGERPLDVRRPDRTGRLGVPQHDERRHQRGEKITAIAMITKTIATIIPTRIAKPFAPDD